MPARRTSNPIAIVRSFYSGALYRDVARNWRGVGLVYLLLVTALCAVPTVIQIQAGVSRFTRVEARPLLEQIPPLRVQDGHVVTEVAMPLVIRGSHGEAFAILDTTGQITSLDSTEARLLVTSTRVVLRKNAAEIRTYELSPVRHFELNRDVAARWLRLFDRGFAFFLAPFALVSMFLFRLGQVIVFAGAGLLLASPLGVRLPFAAFMRLASVAFTPVLLLDAVRSAAGLHVPMWPLLSMILAAGTLLAAIRANREAPPASEGVAPPPG